MFRWWGELNHTQGKKPGKNEGKAETEKQKLAWDAVKTFDSGQRDR